MALPFAHQWPIAWETPESARKTPAFVAVPIARNRGVARYAAK
jgi:hypothetical protein